MIAIPAIDLMDGQVVRLFQGDYSQQTAYPKTPLGYATEIADSGLEYMHLVDLSGAKIGQLVHTPVLQQITAATKLKVDFGGGISSKDDVTRVLQAGAQQVVLGSLCVKEPLTVLSWIREWGAERFVLALDTDGTFLKINGWQDQSEVRLEILMDYFKDVDNLTILTTDIRKDGTGTGANVALYRSLTTQFPRQRWIASGGVETLQDLQVLNSTGCYACVVGKALLEGKISLEALKAFNDGSV